MKRGKNANVTKIGNLRKMQPEKASILRKVAMCGEGYRLLPCTESRQALEDTHTECYIFKRINDMYYFNSKLRHILGSISFQFQNLRNVQPKISQHDLEGLGKGKNLNL